MSEGRVSIYDDRHARFHRTGFHRDTAGKIVIEPEREWYSIKQVAGILTVSITSAWRFIDGGKIRAQRIGGRWRVPYDALHEFLTEGG